MVRLLLVLPVIQALTVIDLPGDWSQILRHKYTPKEEMDLPELSVCMRFYPHKVAGGNVGWQDVLASIMMGRTTSNADQYIHVGFFEKEDGRKDPSGRPWGRIGTNFKGAKFFTGGDVERVPLRWYNLCVTFSFEEGKGTFFQYYLNGELNFEERSERIGDSVWVPGTNLSIGYREFQFTGVPFQGMVTDVQLFSKFLSFEEATGYTSCKNSIKGDLADWNMADWERSLNGVPGKNNEYEID